MSGRTRSDGQPVGRAAVDVFLQYLKAEGARLVFGVPGGLLHPFFEALEADADFELVVTRHEEGAGPTEPCVSAEAWAYARAPPARAPPTC